MANSVVSTRASTIALLVLLTGSSSLAADWLVTREGQRVETRGPWKVKGKMVLFTSPNGTFSSLRLDMVDLDASRETEKAVDEEVASASRIEAEEEPVEPVLVLTDADVPHRPPLPEMSPDIAPKPDIAPEEGEREGERNEGAPIYVSSWQDVETAAGGFDIKGSFRNRSERMASDIQLTVLLYDDEGILVDAVAAHLTTASLGPEEQGQFTASFDRPHEYLSMRFDVSSFDLERK